MFSSNNINYGFIKKNIIIFQITFILHIFKNEKIAIHQTLKYKPNIQK